VRLELGVRARPDGRCGGNCSTRKDREQVMPKTSNEAREAEEIERGVRLFCRHCGERVNEHRVYFGVVGPFCNVECRDESLKEPA